MPTITYRRLIRFGRGGTVITVPKGWMRYCGLWAGDKSEITANGELVARPVTEKPDSK